MLRRGAGRPILVLHGFNTIDPAAPFLDLLGRCGEIIAPSSPGFGNSPRPKDFDTVYDLVHLYLAALDLLSGDKVTLLGFSFGGWLAAEVAAACSHRLEKLVLVDPLGIKISDRETPDILDIFNKSPDEVRRKSWHDPDRFAPDYNAMSDEALVLRARNREALCLYSWNPYMYNPQLPRLAQPDRGADPAGMGGERSGGHTGLRPHLQPADPGFAVCSDRARRAPSRDRAARSVCRAGRRVSRRIGGRGAMQVWYHCENVYPFVPQEILDRAESVRASLPNKYCDPKIAADLFAECLDEHLLCDELGVNVVSIEHHSGINSLYGASPMILGILARQTQKVRILSLGTLITIRPDPVRVAEEYATADVISRGRLEIGFVKSGDSEMVSGNANPVGYVDRFWEAIDLIRKTLTSHDGPFSWEGKHYTHRHVNIWPPVYQRPHPPMWAATGDPETSAELGRRGMVNALVLRGPEASKRAFDAYRDARREAGLPAPGTDRFAYAALCYVGDTDEEGLRVGAKTLWFLNTSLKQSPQMSKFLPGRMPPEVAAQNYRTVPRPGSPANMRPGQSLIGITAEQAIARGILCAGNPDTVYKQIMDIYEKVGGFGHFIFIGRSGFLDHREAEKGIRLMAKEVLPRLPAATSTPAAEPARAAE